MFLWVRIVCGRWLRLLVLVVFVRCFWSGCCCWCCLNCDFEGVIWDGWDGNCWIVVVVVVVWCVLVGYGGFGLIVLVFRFVLVGFLWLLEK